MSDESKDDADKNQPSEDKNDLSSITRKHEDRNRHEDPSFKRAQMKDSMREKSGRDGSETEKSNEKEPDKGSER